MYCLIAENLSNLGNSMETEYVSINFTKYFLELKNAKEYAEKDYGKGIKWETVKDEVRSPDLGFVLYRIRKIFIED